jgi:hypothetical protein
MPGPWFPIACMLIVLVGIWLGIFGPLPEGFWEWLSKWQTLVAAAVASIAAYVAFTNTARTLKHNEHLEKNRRQRKLASLRAMLPVALSAVGEYATSSAEELRKGTDFVGLPKPLPADSLKLLTEFIEYSDSVDVSVLESTVACVQIQHSRIRRMVRDHKDPQCYGPVLRTYLEDAILDSASIYAGVAAYYDYARKRTEHPPTNVSWDEVHSALRNMHFWGPENSHLYEMLDRLQNESGGPFKRLSS